MSLEMKDLHAQLAEGKKKVSELEAQELKIGEEKRRLEEGAKRLQREVADRIAEEVKKREGEIKRHNEEQGALEKKDLQARLQNQDKLISFLSSESMCAFLLLMDSLFRLILWALWTSRSRRASAMVASPITSCQCSMGSWLVTIVDADPCLSSITSHESRSVGACPQES